MMSNFSKRERMLALVAGVMLPAFLLMIGFIWFINALGRYDTAIDDMKTKVSQAKTLQAKARTSERRRGRYVELSLASSPELAKVQYRDWLTRMAEEVFGGTAYSLEPIVTSQIRFKRSNPVAEKLSVKLNVPSANLGQLNEFLYRFYDARILHRISALTATPIVAKTGTSEEMAPTGKMGLLLQIEAISLNEAEKMKAIATEPLGSMPRDLAGYREQIEARNIFGLPNNPPQITSSTEPSEFEGRDIDVGISVREPDENDQLKFELVSTEIESAKLSQRDPSARSAQFTSDPLAPGSYKFTVRVTDSGYPPKSDVREFTLDVKEKAVVVEKPRTEFLHVQEAVVVAIVKDASGVERAWIHARTLGKMHKLSVGESFELDGANWKLVRLDQQSLTLETNGKLQTYRIGDHLDKPRASEAAPTAAATSGG